MTDPFDIEAMRRDRAAGTPGPWWTRGKYDGQEMGCAIIAARTDSGPLPGNPTRGIVAWASAVLNTEARKCEANARRIARVPAISRAGPTTPRAGSCRAVPRADGVHAPSTPGSAPARRAARRMPRR